MSSFEPVTGDLFVGEDASDNEHIDDGEDLYQYAAFVTDAATIVFKSNMGYVPVTDEAFAEEGDDVVYYPYRNETTARLSFGFDTDDAADCLREDITVRAAAAGGDLFVHSQNEVTAYAPNYLVANGNVYEHGQLFAHPNDPGFDGDAFLGLDSTDDGVVYVENVETGFCVPYAFDDLSSIVENEENNGALRVHEPRDLVSDVASAFFDE